MAPILATFAISAVLMLAVMNLAFLHQRATGNSGWIDVFWTVGTGVAGAMAILLPERDEAAFARQAIAALIVLTWSVRLALYVGRRVATTPEDARYARYRREWGARYQRTLYVLVMPQALVTAALCVAMTAAVRPGPLDFRDFAAFGILILAIAGESLADRQLARFKASSPPKGAVFDRGLWAWSRHPNYFFEWLVWLAWPVMGFDPARPVSWLTLIAPIAMYGVLRFMTGVPPLEQAMAESRGQAFAAYKARTSAFFPLPPRKGAPS